MQGYERESDIREVRASTLIGAVTSIMEKSRQGDRRYIFSGEYSLDPALVFINTRIPDAALIYRRTKPMSRREILDCLKHLLQPDDADVRGADYIRKALFLLSDSHKSFGIIRHDLMAVGTEAFRAEC